MSVVLTFAMAAASVPAGAQAVVPTEYVAGHFYATPQIVGGQKLRLLVDTGGGGTANMYWLSESLVQKLRLTATTCKNDGRTVKAWTAPAYVAQQGVPPSLGSCAGKVLAVADHGGLDGQLGSSYLGTRVWTFDYPHQQLRAEHNGWRHDAQAKPTNLGFQKDDTGEVSQFFPRVVMRVDGIPVNMLLDTGATSHATAAGQAATNAPTEANGKGATSYITTRMLDIWHKKHPDWRVVEAGDDLLGPKFPARLIEVPKVQIAGWVVGPVWFTERPNKNFHTYMARMMDETPEGAVGANILSHFSITLDYPRAKAWFSCADGCVAVPAK